MLSCMIGAGMDAHGGNVQNGCGACFVWPAALPYVGDRGARKEMVSFFVFVFFVNTCM